MTMVNLIACATLLKLLSVINVILGMRRSNNDVQETECGLILEI